MKRFFKNIGLVILVLSSYTSSFAAQTVCNDNGGAGWPINDLDITNISIPFNFGDVATAFDVNVSTDITHTWIGDLTVKVTSPQLGTVVRMFERPGTAASDTAPTNSSPYGCNRNDIIVTFDDEAASGINIENECPPVTNGTYLPDDPTLNLSAFDGEDPTGNWNFYLSDSANGDTGTLNQACITVAFASVTFDKWVSTNNTCSDTLDILTVSSGTDVYYCYTVTNPSTEEFTISATSDDQGHDISALQTTYAGNASQTVVIGPLVAGGAELPDNVTTVNTAQVTASFATANFTGDLVTSETASLSVTVNPPAPPASGFKQLYLLNLGSTLDLVRTIPTADENTGNINGGNFVDFTQTPVFQKAFTITANSTVSIFLTLERRNGGGARKARIELFNGNTGALIGTDTFTWNAGGLVSNTYSIAIGGTDINFAAGDYVRLRVSNISANNRRIRVHQLAANLSQIQMDSSTVINIDNLSVYSAAYPATTQLSSYIPGSTIYVRATVSDPFGNADITSTNVTITDSGGTVQVNNVDMGAQIATPDGATAVYEYQYTIPATPDGYWDISTTANEGAEGNISHTATTTMVVGTPTITVTKSRTVLSDSINASNPKSIPGSIVEYTIDVTNSGFGYVDADTFVISDPLAAGVTFFFGSPVNPATFVDGITSSGLSYTFTSLGSTTDDITFYNDGSGTTPVTPTTDANGFDTTVPPIDFIRINPKSTFRGSDGTNDPSMQLKFRVRVK